MEKVLAFAKKLLREKIDKNSIVVDATCGNGNDTLFLAQSSAKKVYAFDIQEQAIINTTSLLENHNLAEKCEVILASHEDFATYISEGIRAAVFNLGYLPNADHKITTLGEVTQRTLAKLLERLEIGGIIVVVIYWGHANGKLEKDIVLDYCAQLDQKAVEVLQYQFINQKNNAPFLVALEKKKQL